MKIIILALLLVAQPAVAQSAPPLQLGGAVVIPSNADNNSAQLGIVGSVVLLPTNVGPAFGAGLCGIGYRNTGEANMDPSLVHRCNTYTWEGADLTWYGTLNVTGFCVGCRANDTHPYPQARLDVRGHNGQNVASFRQENGGTYIRVQATSSSLDGCFIFDVAGEPISAFGRCGALFGRGGNEINYGKFSSGWVYGGTLYSW